MTATYAATSQWNSGFTGDYTITNTGTTPLTNWQLQFDLPSNESVSNLWNGHVVQSGTHYTVTPESYDSTIAPGSSVTVGFQGAQTGAYSAPTNLLVNGQPVSGGTGTGGTGTGGTGTGGTGTGGTVPEERAPAERAPAEPAPVPEERAPVPEERAPAARVPAAR